MKTFALTVTIALLCLLIIIIVDSIVDWHRCYSAGYKAGKMAAINRIVPYVSNNSSIATAAYNKGYRKGYDKWRYS